MRGQINALVIPVVWDRMFGIESTAASCSCDVTAFVLEPNFFAELAPLPASGATGYGLCVAYYKSIILVRSCACGSSTVVRNCVSFVRVA